MSRPHAMRVLALAAVCCAASGCRGPQVFVFESTSITTPADWHEYSQDQDGAMRSLHLKRSGIPLMEKDSIASFYASSNPQTNSAQGAELWQQRTAKSTVGNFVSHNTERVAGRYTSLCVTGTNSGGVEVLDCVVEGAPLMFSFAGSKDAEAEARTILQSLRQAGQ